MILPPSSSSCPGCLTTDAMINVSKSGVILKTPLFYIGLIMTISVKGQTPLINDTIRINEVVVNGSMAMSSAEGFKHSKIDSAAFKENTLGNLSDIISDNTNVYIKSYGSGGIASTSIRGTGAGHTQLTWNGNNINSPMLGQADISLIPAGFLDNIRIYCGTSSMALNYGGIGGIIDIATEPDWKNNGSIAINAGAGSFGRYSGMIKARTGSKNFQSVTKSFVQSAENDFRFLNNVAYNDPVYEHRRNAQVKTMSFLQELYWKIGKSVASARVWYQISDRNLPTALLIRQPVNGESQIDEFFRAIMNYGHYGQKTDYNINASWFTDRLDYFNPTASIVSKNHSDTFTAKGEIGIIPDGKTRFRFILKNETNIIRSVNYDGNKTRNISSLTASVRRVIMERISASLLLQQIMNNGHLLIPDFSSGLDIKVMERQEYYLRFNFSRNSKIPSLNDLYWNPGGNPDLKNEYSYTVEASLLIKGSISPSIEYNNEVTLFSNNIRDLIQWSPTQSGYWTPSNISAVKTSGLEAETNLSAKTANLTIRLNGHYSLTNAYVTKTWGGDFISGKKLIYVPQNKINAGLRIYYKNLYTSWITSFIGRRYISSDNSQYLPYYMLNDLTAGACIKHGKNSFDFNLKIDNIFGVNYQAISYFPMPGRAFLFSFTYKYIK
jgi:vitamin B12 transporter